MVYTPANVSSTVMITVDYDYGYSGLENTSHLQCINHFHKPPESFLSTKCHIYTVLCRMHIALFSGLLCFFCAHLAHQHKCEEKLIKVGKAWHH